MEDGDIKEERLKILKPLSPRFTAIFDSYSEDNKRGNNFGQIIEGLKAGRCFAREGWNGKNMSIYATTLSTEEGFELDNLGLVIITPSGERNNWIPSITDLFAEDWSEVDAITQNDTLSVLDSLT